MLYPTIVFLYYYQENKWHKDCNFSSTMTTQKVKTCFTLTFSLEQYEHARSYVEDMKRHPNRVYWRGKEGKTDEELVIEQIAHRILSGFYHNDPFTASRQILRMDAAVNGQ
jgi:hypothetical protein